MTRALSLVLIWSAGRVSADCSRTRRKHDQPIWDWRSEINDQISVDNFPCRACSGRLGCPICRTPIITRTHPIVKEAACSFAVVVVVVEAIVVIVFPIGWVFVQCIVEHMIFSRRREHGDHRRGSNANDLKSKSKDQISKINQSFILMNVNVYLAKYAIIFSATARVRARCEIRSVSSSRSSVRRWTLCSFDPWSLTIFQAGAAPSAAAVKQVNYRSNCWSISQLQSGPAPPTAPPTAAPNPAVKYRNAIYSLVSNYRLLRPLFTPLWLRWRDSRKSTVRCAACTIEKSTPSFCERSRRSLGQGASRMKRWTLRAHSAKVWIPWLLISGSMYVEIVYVGNPKVHYVPLASAPVS